MVYRLKVRINLFEPCSILATDLKQSQNVTKTIQTLFSAVSLPMTNGPATDRSATDSSTGVLLLWHLRMFLHVALIPADHLSKLRNLACYRCPGVSFVSAPSQCGVQVCPCFFLCKPDKLLLTSLVFLSCCLSNLCHFSRGNT